MTSTDLLKKYDVQAPRYTSYPTVPYWSETPTSEFWIESVKRALAPQDSAWSLYVHVPFCESLCTFCGCNTSITRNHSVEEPYVNTLLKEYRTYLEKVPALRQSPLKQIHLGGGTPTFLAPSQLKALVEGLKNEVRSLVPNFEGSIEVDPRRTTRDQLKTLADCGFRRVSLGVQDFNSEVQRIVNRIQPFEITRDLTLVARDLGYDSVNYDLIYGLPKQTPESFRDTALKTIELRPDRIALYSFALVPWIKPAQRLFKDEDVPMGDEKRNLYEIAYELLTQAGYIEIGMDHFALPSDALYKAHVEHRLHRNFMGYTDQRSEVLLGLGVSSISETPDCFHQNEKVLPVYERRVNSGEIPTLRGHILNEEDQRQRQLILEFMTRMELRLPSSEVETDVREFLNPLIEDGLVRIENERLTMTEVGKPFLRNACMALDLRLRRAKPTQKVFSRSL